MRTFARTSGYVHAPREGRAVRDHSEVDRKSDGVTLQGPSRLGFSQEAPQIRARVVRSQELRRESSSHDHERHLMDAPHASLGKKARDSMLAEITFSDSRRRLPGQDLSLRLSQRLRRPPGDLLTGPDRQMIPSWPARAGRVHKLVGRKFSHEIREMSSDLHVGPVDGLFAVMYNSGAASTYTVAIGGKRLQFAAPGNGWAPLKYKPCWSPLESDSPPAPRPASADCAR